MKKNLFAVAAMLAFAGTAMAQSSVTVFGVVDLAARQIKGADSVSLLQNEGRAQSRIGFRGTEDLGDGMKASFWIESGINADDGTTAGSAFWQRRATVSLSGGFGELRMGRHKFADRIVVDDFDPSGTGNSGMLDVTRIYSGLGSAVGAGYINRANNQVGYHLPAFGNMYGTFDVSAGEGVNADKGYSGRLGYKDKQLHVAGGYGQHGATNKFKTMALGAAYDFGDFSLTGLYVQNKFANRKQVVFTLGGAVKIGAGRVFATAAQANANNAAEAVGTGNPRGDAKYFALGYDYSLSKRTTLYTTVANIKNNGAATFSVNGTRATGGERPVAGGSSRGFEVGVRHTF